jgi:hypothetical protein
VPFDMCVTLEKNSCGAKLLSISCSRTVYLPAGSFSICSSKIDVYDTRYPSWMPAWQGCCPWHSSCLPLPQQAKLLLCMVTMSHVLTR